MSSIADFRLIETSKLDGLKNSAKTQKSFFGKVTDKYFDYLENNSLKLEEFKWSGQIYECLVVYFEENGIIFNDLIYNELSEYLSAEREAICIIITEEEKSKYINSLNPDNYNLNELKDYYNDFYGTNEGDEVGQAMLDGINLLYKNIHAITENNVLVFGVY
jgi:hypothetical protein